MSMSFEQYTHHNAKVWVRSDLKGRHREHCLCYKCKRFDPVNRSNNCRIASKLFELAVEFNLTTPVFECPAFDEKTEEVKPQ